MMTSSFTADDYTLPPSRAMEEMIARIFPKSMLVSILAGLLRVRVRVGVNSVSVRVAVRMKIRVRG